MGYLVTARKWRPQVFDDVVGQEHITETLKNAIKNNRIAHAYLFTGPRGVGKTTTARIYAKVLNCENPKNAEPCNECSMCKEIQTSQSMDIIEIDGASNRGIDEIRTLRESVKYAPTRGKYKVYIIDEVHMLTKESFNAFLKTLEEPPEHTIFIFATTDVHKVPLTIISRCQRFDFRRIQVHTIKETIEKIAAAEKVKIDDKTLTIIAKKSDGALRDAESYFDQIVSFCGEKIDSQTVAQMLNLIGDEIYFRISNAMLNKEFKTVFDVTNKIYENGWDFIDFIEGLTEHFRNIMTIILTGQASLIETAEVYKEQYLNYIDKFSKGDLLRALDFLGKVQQELRFSQNHKLKIEIALSHLIGLERSTTMTELISELNSSSSEKKNILNEPTGNFHPDPEKKLDIDNQNLKETSQAAITKNTDSNIKHAEFSYSNRSNNISPEFKSITDKWQSFINLVSEEKGLTLGPAIKSLNPISLSANKLKVSSSLPDIERTMEFNRKYLENKSELVFGKRLHLFLTSESYNKNKSIEKSLKMSISDKNQKENQFEDPYEEIIIKELGGERIS